MNQVEYFIFNFQASTEDLYWEGEEEASNEFLEVKERDSSLTSHLTRIRRDLSSFFCKLLLTIL